MVNNFFFSKIAPLRDSVERYARSRQATEENIMRRIKKMRLA